MHFAEPIPVKLFAGIIFSDASVVKAATRQLEQKFGEIDFTGKEFDFPGEQYYQKEMGKNLQRKFVSFKKPVIPDKMSDIKVFTAHTENFFKKDNSRSINIDPGYIDFMKVVLLSGKPGPHKIYLSQGVYADLTLIYTKGSFYSFSWTFPDFKDSLYYPELLKIRELYKKQHCKKELTL